LRIEDVLALANRPCRTRCRTTPRTASASPRARLDSLLDKEGVIYGVTTGYGDSCVVAVPLQHVEACRVICTPSTAAAWAAARRPGHPRGAGGALRRCATACPGCRVELLERLQLFLEHDILPLIPEEGSVGASGDLTPLSYVAATLSGEREVLFRGEPPQRADVHRELGWPRWCCGPRKPWR
jgi:histidine ammonia-lyase